VRKGGRKRTAKKRLLKNQESFRSNRGTGERKKKNEEKINAFSGKGRTGSAVGGDLFEP